jgi:putative transposase
VRSARVAPSPRDPAPGLGLFCNGAARPPLQARIAFIDDHRPVDGVEPICRVLPVARSIARSSDYEHTARRRNPACLPTRARRDEVRRSEIRRVWEENFQVYGVREVWRPLCREGIAVARCTSARLVRQMGLSGAVRGKAVKTTISNPAVHCPRDKVNRQFQAPRPNAL